jgi:hypothetical protein
VPRYLARVVSLFLALSLAGPAQAAEPPPEEVLPPPHPAVPPGLAPGPVIPPPLPIELMLFPRHNRYEVWQYYGTDITGHWRPRVIATAHGAYYLYNGAPYPWYTTHPLEYRPYVSNPATFGQ